MPFTATNTPYPAVPALPGDAGGFSVLVFEDQTSVRAALVAEQRHTGVSDIFKAPAGGAALHLFKARRPDLVLLDIKLPGQDGYWVAQQMRESEAGDHLRARRQHQCREHDHAGRPDFVGRQGARPQPLLQF